MAPKPSPAIYRDDYFGRAREFLPKNLKSFFFLRHGETDANVKGHAQGQRDNPLNDKGRQQAIAVQPIVNALTLQQVVCSPLVRASETAELAVALRELEVTVEENFKERGFGKFEGTKPPANLYTEDLPTTEKREDFSIRIAKAMRHFVVENRLLVAHGDINRLLIGLLDASFRNVEDLGNAQLLLYKKTIAGWEVINLSAQNIASIKAIEVIDSAGRPIVEVTVTTERGAEGTEAAPTGTTVGGYEPHVLRDGDKSRYNGLGVQKAIKNVKEVLAPALFGMSIFDQEAIDGKMLALDGTADMSKLGGNAISSISAAVFRAAAASVGMELSDFIAGGRPISLPIPIFNIVNGKRSGDRNDLIYENIIVPYGASSYAEAVRMGVEIHKELGKVIEKYLGQKPSVGASGGYSAPSQDPNVVFGLMQKAIDLCGYTGKVALAFDCAACDVFDRKDNTYPWMGGRVTAKELIRQFNALAKKFDIVFIEDGFDENDFDSFGLARKEIKRTVIAGDDLTVTNIDRMKVAVERSAIDGFIFKPGQAGTVTGAFKALALAADMQWLVAASARGGGPMTDIVRDISLGSGKVHFYKAGAPLNGGHRTEALCEGIRTENKHGSPLVDVTRFLNFHFCALN